MRTHGKGQHKLLRQPVPPSDAGDTSVGTSLLGRSAWPRPPVHLRSGTIRFTSVPCEKGAALRHRGRVVEPGGESGDLGAAEALRVHARWHQPVILVIETHSAVRSFAKRSHHALLRHHQRVPARQSCE